VHIPIFVLFVLFCFVFTLSFILLVDYSNTSENNLLKELAITSDEALSLEELPKRAVILGGG
jgi:glutathione reductase (NADPH)